MSSRYIKVEGHSGWYKDIETGTIINTNEQEISIARATRENYLKRKNVQDKLENDVSSLRSEISELKKLIQGMIGK
jgi:hypothetical protein